MVFSGLSLAWKASLAYQTAQMLLLILHRGQTYSHLPAAHSYVLLAALVMLDLLASVVSSETSGCSCCLPRSVSCLSCF